MESTVPVVVDSSESNMRTNLKHYIYFSVFEKRFPKWRLTVAPMKD